MEADQQKLQQATGFPVANFSLAAEVTPEAVLFPRILHNTPVLGEWLQLWGACEVSIEHPWPCLACGCPPHHRTRIHKIRFPISNQRPRFTFLVALGDMEDHK